MLRQVLAAGGDAHARNEYLETPLFFARSVPDMELLVQRKAKMFVVNVWGQTVFDKHFKQSPMLAQQVRQYMGTFKQMPIATYDKKAEEHWSKHTTPGRKGVARLPTPTEARSSAERNAWYRIVGQFRSL